MLLINQCTQKNIVNTSKTENWETAEDKQCWRESGGWITAEDLKESIKAAANDIKVDYNGHLQSINEGNPI
jgi:hypothetical protein